MTSILCIRSSSKFLPEKVKISPGFNLATQLSIASLDKIKLLPNTSEGFKRATRKSLIELIAPSGVLIVQNMDGLASRLDNYFGEAEKSFAALSGATQHLPPATLFLSKNDLLDSVDSLSWVSVLASAEKKTKAQVFVKQSPQPAFNRKFDRLIAYLNENHEKGYQNYICCASAEQAQRLNAIFEEMDQTVHYKTVVQPLFEGFEDIEAKMAIFPVKL